MEGRYIQREVDRHKGKEADAEADSSCISLSLGGNGIKPLDTTRLN
jgi:hypothetical protein